MDRWTFEWKAVDKEIEEKKPQNEEYITTLTRDMFVVYIQWFNENAPDLHYIVATMYRL